VYNIIPECIVLGKMSEGHYLPNRVTAYRPVVEISATAQNPRFLRSQVRPDKIVGQVESGLTEVYCICNCALREMSALFISLQIALASVDLLLGLFLTFFQKF